MNNNRSVIIAAVAAFLIGSLFGYNLHEKSSMRHTGGNDGADRTYAEGNVCEKENLILRSQLRKAASDNEVLYNQVTSLKAQMVREGIQFAEDCRAATDENEGEAEQILDRIRSLLSRERK